MPQTIHHIPLISIIFSVTEIRVIITFLKSKTEMPKYCHSCIYVSVQFQMGQSNIFKCGNSGPDQALELVTCIKGLSFRTLLDVISLLLLSLFLVTSPTFAGEYSSSGPWASPAHSYRSPPPDHFSHENIDWFNQHHLYGKCL